MEKIGIPSEVNIGIPNLGNTCFLNAFLKHLAFHSEYRDLREYPLNRQEGESEELFTSRIALKNVLLEMFDYLLDPANAGTNLSPKHILQFMSLWNHIKQVEEHSANKTFGFMEVNLRASDQEDAALVLRKIYQGMEFPKLSTKQTLDALSLENTEVFANLSQKTRYETLNNYMPIYLNESSSQQQVSFQDLLNEQYGQKAKVMEPALEMWLDSRESLERLPALKRTYFAEDTPGITFIVEDRIFPDENFQFQKNHKPLKIEIEVEIPTFRKDGSYGTKIMQVRSVVVHHGGSMGGHYVTYSYEKDDNDQYFWVEHNDSTVYLQKNLSSMASGSRIIRYEEKS